MSTFNLRKHANKKEDNTHKHTNKMLSEEHKKTPNVITEKQLEKDSVPEKHQLTERQLDQVRQSEEHKTIEGRLNAHSETDFEIYHRNESAYKGDINKIEEQRISKSRQEDEKYDVASETKKDLRWWEKNKKEDHLIVAKAKESMKRIAQAVKEDEVEETSFDDSKSFDRLKGIWDEMENGISEKDIGNEFIGGSEEVEPEEDDLELGASKDMFIADKKENMPQGLNPYILYISVGYDPAAWDDEIELQNAVIDKVLEIRPDLDGKISSDDLGKPKSFGNRSYVPVRLIGDEFMVSENGVEEMFSEDKFEVADIGGTPVQIGEISINMDEAEIDDETIAQDVADYVNDIHSGLNISADSIEINYNDMKASFVVGMGNNAGNIDRMPSPSAEDDFPVTEVEASQEKEVKTAEKKHKKK